MVAATEVDDKRGFSTNIKKKSLEVSLDTGYLQYAYKIIVSKPIYKACSVLITHLIHLHIWKFFILGVPLVCALFIL